MFILNLTVPYFLLVSPRLFWTVATQRRNYRVFMSGSDEPSGMTAERVQSLEEIGFQWTVGFREQEHSLCHP
jgi:Helicase associated domain